MQKLIIYIKEYNENKKPSHLKYWDINRLYGWVMSQKPPEKIAIKEVMKDIFSKLIFNILENYMNFIPERMKIEIVKKPITNLYDKTDYVIDIRNLKRASNQGPILIKVHRVIKFNQKAWLKPYINMKKKLR